MKQYEAVIRIMEQGGGFATLGYLNQEVLKMPGVEWKTKTPFASIRRIVQDKRFFFKIRPGMWHGKNSNSGELIKVANLDFAEDDELIKEIKADYDFVRAKLIKQSFKSLTGKDGKWIQARTKGTGGVNPRTRKKRPITRAFYAKTSLVKKFFEIAS